MRLAIILAVTAFALALQRQSNAQFLLAAGFGRDLPQLQPLQSTGPPAVLVPAGMEPTFVEQFRCESADRWMETLGLFQESPRSSGMVW